MGTLEPRGLQSVKTLASQEVFAQKQSPLVRQSFLMIKIFSLGSKDYDTDY